VQTLNILLLPEAAVLAVAKAAVVELADIVQAQKLLF